jgi:hypothetical protein
MPNSDNVKESMHETALVVTLTFVCCFWDCFLSIEKFMNEYEIDVINFFFNLLILQIQFLRFSCSLLPLAL